jgi:hypothetical protein
VSIAEFALRRATVEVLRTAFSTPVAVLDTPVTPEEFCFSSGYEEGRPDTTVVAILTNISEFTPSGSSDIYGNGFVELAVQFYIPFDTGISVPNQELAGFKGRDEGGAFVYDMLLRRMQRAFLLDQTAWGDFRRRLIQKYVSRRKVSFVVVTKSKGIEIMAKEVVFRYELAPDPTPGDVNGFWTEFLSLLDAGDAESQAYGVVIRSDLEADDALPEWRVQAAEIGVGASEAVILGIGASPGLPPTETPVPLLQRIDIRDEAGGDIETTVLPA